MSGKTPPATWDEELLGAESPLLATRESDAGRIERVRHELESGFAALAGIAPAVSVFGSARTPRGHPRYELARAVGRRLGEAGFSVITGGGGGMMEAANRGAAEAGATSVGLNIELPVEQETNAWVNLPMRFHYFYTRKLMFVRYASGFAVLPGGFGTMDEMFEALTLMQTGKAIDFAVVLLDRSYWAGLLEWLREGMLGDGMLSPGDLDLLTVCDDPEDAVEVLSGAAARQGLPA